MNGTQIKHDIGPGDYTLEEWNDGVTEAKEQLTPDTARFPIDHPLLEGELQ